jgi:hypothetical protein
MPTEPWPCWTCKHKAGPDTSGTYSCARPVTAQVAYWERRHLVHLNPMWRNLGTAKQLSGESQNDRPDCVFAEK